ncbi:MAG: NAD(P)H-hydrate dehydratase [Clostridia bacterium]|nr:NAD(P)H-hydrate dehydratase [Clostridia bacterium]
MYLLTPEQSRAADRFAIEELKVPGKLLMQNAGVSVAQIARELLAGREAPAVLVLCGSGNNGGDGYVAAAVLAGEGVSVIAAEYEPEKKRSGDAALHRSRAKKILKTFYPLEKGPFFSDALARADLVIDALYGTGFRAPLPADLAGLLDEVNASRAKKLAIDVPSGVDCAAGTADPHALVADVTAAMSYPMRSLLLLPGRAYAGRIEVCDLGVDYRAIERQGRFTEQATDEAMLRAVFSRRPTDSNKGTYGKLLLVCGSEKMPGACLLALSGALRVGPGLVEVCAPKAVCDLAAVRHPEALFFPLPDPENWTERDLVALLSEAEKADAVLVGCGLGVSENVKLFVSALLSTEGAPAVLDADALNALAACGYPAERGGREVVLTPHPLEFSRLSGLSREEIAADRVAAAKRYAAERGVTLLLKGADTVTVSPEGEVLYNPTGNPGLAKGGSGDVLAGMLAGLLAQGKPVFTAAAAAAWLHGAAGDLLARDRSEYGYLPSDLPEAAARALARLLR